MITAWPFQAAITPIVEAAPLYTSITQTRGGSLLDGSFGTALAAMHSSPAIVSEPGFAVFITRTADSLAATQVLPPGRSYASARAFCHRAVTGQSATAQRGGLLSHRQLKMPIATGMLDQGTHISHAEVDGTPLPKMSLLGRLAVNAAEGGRAVQMANSKAIVPAVDVRAAVAIVPCLHTAQGDLQFLRQADMKIAAAAAMPGRDCAEHRSLQALRRAVAHVAVGPGHPGQMVSMQLTDSSAQFRHDMHCLA